MAVHHIGQLLVLCQLESNFCVVDGWHNTGDLCRGSDNRKNWLRASFKTENGFMVDIASHYSSIIAV